MRFIFYLLVVCLFSTGGTAWNVSAGEKLLSFGPYLQALDKEEVTIVWVTHLNTIGNVCYSENCGDTNASETIVWDQSLGVKNSSKIHAVRLYGLKPGHSYTYSISSQRIMKVNENVNLPLTMLKGTEESVDNLNGQKFSFTTWPEQIENITFLILNDLHHDNDVHRKLLEVADYKTADFICYNGDNAGQLLSIGAVYEDFLKVPMDLFASNKPFYLLRGNHEARGIIVRELPYLFPTTSGRFYYTLYLGDICFVMLDSGERFFDSNAILAGMGDYDGYRREELNWLENLLKSENYQKARRHIFFSHIPPERKVPEQLKTDFLDLYFKGNADLLFSGHFHSLSVKEYTRGEHSFVNLINANNTVARVAITKDRIDISVLDQSSTVKLQKTLAK